MIKPNKVCFQHAQFILLVQKKKKVWSISQNKIVKMITSIERTLADEKFLLAIQHSGAFSAFVLLKFFPFEN